MPQETQESNPRARTRSASTAKNVHANAEPESNTLTDALLGTDPPIEQAHPGLQPALVFGSYPIALIVLISIIALYFLFVHSNPSDGNAPPIHTELSK